MAASEASSDDEFDNILEEFIRETDLKLSVN